MFDAITVQNLVFAIDIGIIFRSEATFENILTYIIGILYCPPFSYDKICLKSQLFRTIHPISLM